MAAFEKGHKKAGGRKKGTSNKATQDLRQLIDRMLPDEELWKLWKQKRYSRDQHIAIKALEIGAALSLRQADDDCGGARRAAAGQDRHQRDPATSRADMISPQLESVTIGDYYTPQPKQQAASES